MEVYNVVNLEALEKKNMSSKDCLTKLEQTRRRRLVVVEMAMHFKLNDCSHYKTHTKK